MRGASERLQQDLSKLLGEERSGPQVELVQERGIQKRCDAMRCDATEEVRPVTDISGVSSGSKFRPRVPRMRPVFASGILAPWPSCAQHNSAK